MNDDWNELAALAVPLEIQFERDETGVTMRKFQGPMGYFADSKPGHQAAREWLQSYQAAAALRDEMRRKQ